MKPLRSRRNLSWLASRCFLPMAVAACAYGPGTAFATSDLDRVSGYAAVMSNYVGRGLSQSVGRPSVQVEVNYYASSGWYAGLDVTTINWVDKVYVGSDVHLELDAYAGYRWIDGDWTFKAYAMQMIFPGDYAPQTPPAQEPDTTEVVGLVAWRGLSAKLNYSVSDSFGTPDSKGSWYFSLGAGHAFAEKWYASAGVSRKQPRGRNPQTSLENSRNEYTAYRVALTRAFDHDISVSLEQTWTNAEPALYTVDGYNVAGSQLALIVQKNF